MTLTGAQKCAILVLLLEEAQAAEMLRRLGPDEVQAVGEAMLTVAEIEPAVIDAVLDEFLDRTRTTTALDADGREARARLSAALGHPRSAKMIDRLGPPAAKARFAMLAWLAPATIAAAITDEHPQAIAVTLAHLGPERAAAVLDSLPAPLRPDIATRLATLRPVSLAALDALEEDIDACLAALDGRQEMVSLAGTDFAAALVKNSRHKGGLIESLAGLDASLAAEIEAQQFLFADLAVLSSRDMQQVLREVPPDTLAVALKGADAAMKTLVFGGMSKRAAAALADDIAQRGPLKLADVRAAQAEVCRVARTLADAGTIRLPDGEGAYV